MNEMDSETIVASEPSVSGHTEAPQMQIIDPLSCIVIHPGSKYLRLGRPCDSVPFTVLHAIARKNKSKMTKRTDSHMISLDKLTSDKIQTVEDCRIKVCNLLQSCLMSDGTRRFATNSKQLSVINKKVTPVINEKKSVKPPSFQEDADFVIGDKVLEVPSSANYHIIYPWHRGDLNIRSAINGSVKSVMSDLQTIWTAAIEEKLNVHADSFKSYKCVVVIPNIYNRENVVHITNLVLKEMGFGACFVFQDDVAATFGSGVGSACVVDIGDQKTSISCVEDALSISNSRLRLRYGGSDISQVLHWLLRKSGFTKSLEPSTNCADYDLLTSLKHSKCHVNLDRCGPEECPCEHVDEDNKPMVYNIQLADELLIAPLSLCYPTLLTLTGDKSRVVTMGRNTGHSEDPFDDIFLRENSRKTGREIPDETDTIEDLLQSQTADNLCRMMSLEQAITLSVERCPEEARRRMFSTIILVGAGANFPQFGKWLQHRLVMQIPVRFRPDQIDVISRAKDMDPAVVAWKGASLMTGLEGSSELWIAQEQWLTQGVKVLREKCPFVW